MNRVPVFETRAEMNPKRSVNTRAQSVYNGRIFSFPILHSQRMIDNCNQQREQHKLRGL
jgi:hypothetical protein